MTEKERYKIISNDYADIIVEYNSVPLIFERYPNATIHIMNERHAIAHIPLSAIDEDVSGFGFASIPTLYGLTSEESLRASGVQRLRRLPNFNLRGQGVLIAIIDTGIDYTNPIFRREDGRSKIISIWDQTIESVNQYPEGFFYGTVYSQEQITQAVNSDNPLSIVPSVDTNGHGTMLAGVAAGNESPENEFSGVVPDAEIIVVKLKQAKQNLRDFFLIPEDADCYQENDLMWAITFVVDSARRLNRPISICIGMGTSQSSHDGRLPLGHMLSIAADFPGNCITASAGNEGDRRRHYFDTIDPSIGYSIVELSVGEGEEGFSMELWGAAPTTYSIDILSPSGEYIPRIVENLQVNREISFIFENTTIYIDYEMVESMTGDHLILFRFRNPTPGIYRLQVYGRGDLPGSFHIWLPMGDFISNNTFFVQSNPYTTITSPGNTENVLTATAYNTTNGILYIGASKGFTRTDSIKPDLAAPGVGITGPDLEHGFTLSSGTGVAAAHTAGIGAMLLEWGIVRGLHPGIDTTEIKKFLIRGAKRNEILQYPNQYWGYGVLDIYNVFEIFRNNFQT